MTTNRRNFLKSIPALGAIPALTASSIPESAPEIAGPGLTKDAASGEMALSDNPTADVAGAYPSAGVESADAEISSYGNVIPAPEDPAEWEAFRMNLKVWRTEAWKKYGYNGESYADPAFRWAQSNFACCFLMMYDLDFYDPVQARYTVSKVVQRGLEEFGGYDSVVLWHAYPRIGVDERNQFDFYRDMPGGLEGLRAVTESFHRHGVRVFINYNPWDTGTRREGKADIDALVDIVRVIDADGIFLDTMKEGGADFRKKLDAIRPGIILEGELPAELAILPTHHQSWAQWFGDRFVPGILRNKWFERRHIQHNIARWNRDHSTELHQAWMNGSGIMVWENVFGQYMAWSERDKSILRLTLPVQRRYADIFSGEGWTPLVPTLTHGVFASLWEGRGIRVWTLINRRNKPVEGRLLAVDSVKGTTCYDLFSATPQRTNEKGRTLLKGRIPARGIACFVSGTKKELGSDFPDFLNRMKKIYAEFKPETGFPEMRPVMRQPEPTMEQVRRRDKGSDLEGMVEILPAAILQRIEMQGRECGTYYSYPPAMSVRPAPERVLLERDVFIGHIAVDITPVTNRQYFNFLQESGYKPRHLENFLKHWDGGHFPEGLADHPVVYVDLDDARAYARWAGKRLLREEEWQFAAQGYARLKYPWGAELKAGCYNSGDRTTPVDAFPEGKSPFGCLDMVGNTWELTESEYADVHNRFCILKGGSYFEAKGSHWYVRGGPQPPGLSTKFLLLYPGIDRCATIGFRCARDLS